jgi:hypothetical protein
MGYTRNLMDNVHQVGVGSFATEYDILLVQEREFCSSYQEK